MTETSLTLLQEQILHEKMSIEIEGDHQQQQQANGQM